MALFHAVSSGFAWFTGTFIRLMVWMAFSWLCYFAVALLPLDFMGSLVIGGWIGAVFDVFRISLAVAVLYLYLYCSVMIFFAKNFFVSW